MSRNEETPPLSDPDALAAWVASQVEPAPLLPLLSDEQPVAIRRIVVANARPGILPRRFINEMADHPVLWQALLASPSMTEQRIDRLLTDLFDRLADYQSGEFPESLILRLYEEGHVTGEDLLRHARRVLHEGPTPSTFCAHIFEHLPCWHGYTAEDIERLVDLFRHQFLRYAIRHPQADPRFIIDEVRKSLHGSIQKAVGPWFDGNDPSPFLVDRLLSDLHLHNHPVIAARFLTKLPDHWKDSLRPQHLVPYLESEYREARLMAQTLLASVRGRAEGNDRSTPEDPTASTRGGR